MSKVVQSCVIKFGGAEGSVLQSSLTQIHPLPFEEPQLRKEQGLGVRLIIK